MTIKTCMRFENVIEYTLLGNDESSLKSKTSKIISPIFPQKNRALAFVIMILFCLALFSPRLHASPTLQRQIINDFTKAMANLNEKSSRDFEQIALQTKDDQALIAHRMSRFLDEALKLQKESKKSLIPARLQGLFWYSYRAGQYDIASSINQLLTSRYSGQPLPLDLKRAAQDANKRIAAAKTFLPRIESALKAGNYGQVRKLIDQAEENNPYSPDIMVLKDKLYQSTAQAQQILNEMRKAYQDQNYQLLSGILEKMKTETAKSPGAVSFLNEATQLLNTAKKNVLSSNSLTQEAIIAQDKGLTIDAAQRATEALKLFKNNAQAADILKQWGKQLESFELMESQINDSLNKNDFSGARNLYQEISRLPSSQSDEFMEKSAEYDKMALEQIDQIKAISILLEQERFIEVLPGIKKWVPHAQKKAVGQAVGRELEKQKQYELSLKYYELTEEAYLINRARDLLAKESSKFDAKTLQARMKKSVVKITTVTDEATGTAKSGTGFIISQNGYILTNWHVIEGGKMIQITLDKDQQPLNATLILEGSSQEHDIALLKADGLLGVPLQFGNSDALGIGDKVFTIGNPLLTSQVITEGTLSGRQKGIQGYEETLILVAGIPADHGNSGGPLFNEFGEVVGVLMGGAEDTRISIVVDIRNFSDKIAPYTSR